MTEEDFWVVIDQGVMSLDSGYSFDLHYAKYLSALKTLSDEELIEFATIHSLLVNKAETCDVSQAVFLISNGCGDDDFAAFIAGVIAQGKDTYYAVLEDPEQALLKLPNATLLKDSEDFEYAASDLYSERTGADGLDTLPGNSYGIECVSNDMAEYSEDLTILRRKFPRLFAKYWKGSLPE